MNTLATVWLLVLMGTAGDLRVIGQHSTAEACQRVLRETPADSGAFCMQATRPVPKRP